MSWTLALLSAVVVQRLGELWLSARNTARLRARGGIEHGRGHYPVMVALHGSWLVALFTWWAWHDPALVPGWAAVFLLLQVFRVWTIVSLGPNWTTRVIVVPGDAAVSHGPYRHLRHPNYLIVAAEIAILPLALGAWQIAVAFSAANALLLRHRIRIEDAAREAAERIHTAMLPKSRSSER